MSSFRITGSLESELIRHMELVDEWQDLQVSTQAEYDQSLAYLAVAKAELEARMRSLPAAYGLQKATEGEVSAALTRDASIRELEAAVLTAKRKANVAKAAVAKLQHRKSILKMLADIGWSGGRQHTDDGHTATTTATTDEPVIAAPRIPRPTNTDMWRHHGPTAE